MTLGETQREFTLHVAWLIFRMYARGYEATLGDAFRDPRSHGGMGEKGVYGEAESAHKQRLAIDINLFKDGVYLPTTEAHAEFGKYWKLVHPENRWGGDFVKRDGSPKPDGNHYSRAYKGIA